MNKYNWSNKDIFLKDWSENKNICSFLKKQGLTATSGNYQTFKKWFGIHTEGVTTKENDASNIFSENSFIKRSTISKKIKELKLLPYECACCKNTGLWNGKTLTLQLEHKNGVNNDNRIENLEFLCPNCHSQTGSFMGSNVHNKVFEKRITDIISLQVNEISSATVKELSTQWSITVGACLSWIRQYDSKIKEYNIYLHKSLYSTKPVYRKEDYLKYKDEVDCVKKLVGLWQLSEDRVKRLMRKYETEKNLYLNRLDSAEIKTNDIKESISQDNPLLFLSELWRTDASSVKEIVRKFNLIHLHTSFETLPVCEVDILSRSKDVELIKTKKEVLALSKKWNTSVNGAKKWIRNNMPDKFAEIYDDKHLVKNQQKNILDEKINYIKSLIVDFNQEEAMAVLKVNKPGLFSLLSKYNPSIIESLHSKYPCPRCRSNTRTNGEYQRCISCNHNFRIN